MQTSEINILELETVDSTNSYAKINFESLDDGTLVCAETQTGGRGRLGRRWASPAGVNIYASLVMKQIQNPFYATITASLAVLQLLQSELPREYFFIKWPNDIYTGCRKICGILSECHTANTRIGGVIAGMGINVNMESADLNAVGQPAASLKSLSGKVFDLSRMIRQLAGLLARYYALYLNAPEKLFAEWKEHNIVIGRQVQLTDASGGKLRSPFVRAIAESGELIVEEGGVISRYSCGDVTLVKESLSFPAFEYDTFFDKKN